MYAYFVGTVGFFQMCVMPSSVTDPSTLKRDVAGFVFR